MKILFGSQFYAPSIGGVQEVMRQLAEAMVGRGHEVFIATSADSSRDFSVLNGVTIREFEASGNLATGLAGAVGEYRDFVAQGKFDLLMVMAAQQWTFDALWPILDHLPETRKVLIPCGFSGFYDPLYSRYFEQIPQVLAKFDHLVFHSSKYRDIDFARSHGLSNFSIIPCGASEADFEVEKDLEFRARNGIPKEDFLFLTVGSFTGLKGHREVAAAFERLQIPEGKSATLILNGNRISYFAGGAGGIVRKVLGLIRDRGIRYVMDEFVARFFRSGEGVESRANRINSARRGKRVLITDLPRQELVQAFLHADLFVFASNVEYSPLVLFETVAAGTPFLSVNVGNAPEIAEWTGAGIICPSTVDALGYTRVDEGVLAEQMSAMMEKPQQLSELGNIGRNTWRKYLTWGSIAQRYEQVFLHLVT